MRTLGKFTIICNVCFLFAAIMQFIEVQDKTHAVQDTVQQLPIWLSSIVLLGMILAIFANVLLLFLVFIFKLTKNNSNLPKVYVIISGVMLAAQIVYFFVTAR
jgi:heme/copper-type cytochrome/quinol oxidase subunit 2